MTGQFATQWSRRTLEKERRMEKFHFKMWGCGDWKCWHCPKKADTYQLASQHYNLMHRAHIVTFTERESSQ